MPESKRAVLIGVNNYLDPTIPSLYGCANDANALRVALVNDFDFASDHVRVLINENATRDAILQAWDDLVTATQPGDIVVLSFSGHGSTIMDLEGDEPDGEDETIVPYDSGRVALPNRDITDDEIFFLLTRLNQKTDKVTLIMDCCHSGSITRDIRGGAARLIAGDSRSMEAMGRTPLPEEVRRTIFDAGIATGSWFTVGQGHTLFSGCAASELSYEYVPENSTPEQSHGALTYFLLQELSKSNANSTYRDLYERAASKVTQNYPRQHPQLEGVWDRELFGTKLQTAKRYISVLGKRGNQVRLGAGLAHGMQVDARWRIIPPVSAEQPAPLAEAQIVSVSAVDCWAELYDVKNPVSVNDRAFELARAPGASRFGVWLSPHLPAPPRVALSGMLQASKLLAITEDESQAQAWVHWIPARASVTAHDPVPQLGPLAVPCCAVTGIDGRLLMPCTFGEVLPSILKDNLEKVARYRHSLAIADPGGVFGGRIRFNLLRQNGEAWEVANVKDDSLPAFTEGKRIGFEVINNTQVPVYISILEFGLAWEIYQLYPWEGSNQQLAPGQAFRFGIDDSEGMILELPDSYERMIDPLDTDLRPVVTWKLVASREPASFHLLLQEGVRSASMSSIEALFGDVLLGSSTRQVVRMETQTWTVVDRSYFINGEAE